MTQPISFDEPLGTVRDGQVQVSEPWFRYFVDVGDVDLTADVSGILPQANGGTGVASLTPTIIPISAFLNSWGNFGAARTSASYWVDIQGVIHMQGLIAGGTIGLAAFTLPVVVRPAKTKGFAVMGQTPPCRIDVQFDGDVVPQLGTNGFQSLEGITFLPGT